jgi:MFS family permease
LLQTSGSAAKTGVVAFFVNLPHFASGLLGGTLVDRFGYKRISVIAEVVSGISIGLIPLFYKTVGQAFWQLLVLVFFGALLEIPGVTARRSLLPGLAATAGIRLEQINASFESIQSIALLLGPPIAGVLVGVVGATSALWVDSASFFCSAAIVGTTIPVTIAAIRGAASGRYFT